MIKPNRWIGSSTPLSRLVAYSSFDFANSSISLVIHAYLFPLYFKNVLFQGTPQGDAVWGTVFSLSVLGAALLAPFLGRYADGRRRYRIFSAITWASFIGIGLLGLSIGNHTITIVLAFFLANVTFYLASNAYDSLLTLVAHDNAERVRLSSTAWGIGYLGGICCFLGVYFLQTRYGIASQIPYLFTALFYTTFGCISLWLLQPHVQGRVREAQVTLRDMLRVLDRGRLIQLGAFWMISDAINAVIFFTAIYASTQLHLSAAKIGGLLLAVQLIAVPATAFLGAVARRIGPSRALQVCVVIWLCIVAILVFGRSYLALGALTLLTGIVIGSTQALMRAQYSASTNALRTSEIFGWYSIATESASVVAPILFGWSALISHDERIAMALLALPLAVGLFIISYHGRNYKETLAR